MKLEINACSVDVQKGSFASAVFHTTQVTHILIISIVSTAGREFSPYLDVLWGHKVS